MPLADIARMEVEGEESFEECEDTKVAELQKVEVIIVNIPKK